MQKLKEHWGLKYTYQVWLVLLVFCLTGTSIVLIKPYFIEITHIPKWLYYIIILPIYQLVLLMYGYLLGLGNFFWEKEKRFYHKIVNIFRQKK